MHWENKRNDPPPKKHTHTHTHTQHNNNTKLIHAFSQSFTQPYPPPGRPHRHSAGQQVDPADQKASAQLSSATQQLLSFMSHLRGEISAVIRRANEHDICVTALRFRVDVLNSWCPQWWWGAPNRQKNIPYKRSFVAITQLHCDTDAVSVTSSKIWVFL